MVYDQTSWIALVHSMVYTPLSLLQMRQCMHNMFYRIYCSRGNVHRGPSIECTNAIQLTRSKCTDSLSDFMKPFQVNDWRNMHKYLVTPFSQVWDWAPALGAVLKTEPLGFLLLCLGAGEVRKVEEASPSPPNTRKSSPAVQIFSGGSITSALRSSL